MRNIQSQIKLRKRSRTTYYLGCKDFTHNFRPQEVKMIKKVFRKKSKCVIFWSNKSRFLKQKHNNEKYFQQQPKLSNSFFNL